MGRIIALFLILTALAAACTVVVPPARAAAASADSWTTMAPMPTARDGLGVVAVNGKIYAIGGDAGAQIFNAIFNTNEVYDPATNNWTTKAPMPTARNGFGIAIYLNKIYCIGGWAAGPSFGQTGVNEVYDPLTNTWATKAPMPTGRGGLTASVVNGKIYLIGGYSSSGVCSLNEVYDPASDTWTTMAPLHSAVGGYASAVVDNKIYVIGGGTEDRNLNLNQIYNSQTDSWSTGAPMPTSISRSCASAAATTGVWAPKRIYAVGAIFRSYNQIYNPETNNWSTGAPMPTPTVNMGVAVVDDVLYVVGGSSNLQVLDANERYTPVGYGAVLSVASPQNNSTYASGNIALTYSVNSSALQLSYSLDGLETVTLSANTTLTGLSSGLHNVTVYATDPFGNTDAIETITFTVEPFPIIWVAAAAVAVLVVVAAGLLAYFRKRSRFPQTRQKLSDKN